MRDLLALPLLVVVVSMGLAQEPEPPPVIADADPDSRIHLVREPSGHTAVPRYLVFTSDGKKLISTGDDRTIQVWNLATKERVRVIRPPLGVNGQGGVAFVGQALVVDRKGERVAFSVSAKDDKGKEVRTTFVCSLDSGEAQTLKRFGPRDFAPDGKTLAIGEGNSVHLVDIATDTLSQSYKVKNNVVNLAYSPDGKTLAVVTGENLVYLFDSATLKPRPGRCSVAGTGNVLRSVTWADDKTLVCHTLLPERALVVFDAVTAQVKQSYPLATLLNSIPKGREGTEGLLEVHALAGTTKALVRATHETPIRHHANVTFVFDWASGEAGKAYEKVSDFGCNATAIASDLSIAAQGDGNLNDVILWDPREGKAFTDDKVERRLRAEVRGAGGQTWKIRWRPDGKAIVWEKLTDGKEKGPAELDLTSLTFANKGWTAWDNYGRENVKRALGDNQPSKSEKEQRIFERGLARECGPLKLANKDPKIEITGGDQPVICNVGGFTYWDYTFVGASRIVTHGWGSGVLAVFDTTSGQRLFATKVVQSYIHSIAVSPKADQQYVLIGSADQTLTVFNATTGKVLLTVYPTGQDWIAWTPEGYYAATPGGERLMGWVVESGPDQLGTFHPAARFRAKLYRPDVIKLLLQEGSLDKALKAADKARGQVSKPVTIEQVLPPQVAVTISAKPGTALKDGQLHIDAVATPEGADPITALQLLIDQRPHAGDKGLMTVDRPRPGPVKASWQVELPAGPHEIRVLARTGASLGTSRGMGVLTEANKPNARKAATLYLLAVGINAYPKPLALAGAVNDATELEKTLRKHKAPLFREMEARVLLDRAATKAGILKGFDWLKDRMTVSDVAVVFYAGHGAIENKEFYLLPQDVNPRNLKATGLSRQEIKQRMQGLPGRVLVLLDACHSAAIGFLFEDLTRELIDEDCGVMVMCAARPNEVGLEKNGHGHFTRSLVEGLSGKALTSPRDQCVYLHHLQQYVMDRVDELSNDTQHPTAVVPPWMRPFGLSKPQ